jgi:hypothetical protein
MSDRDNSEETSVDGQREQADSNDVDHDELDGIDEDNDTEMQQQQNETEQQYDDARVEAQSNIEVARNDAMPVATVTGGGGDSTPVDQISEHNSTVDNRQTAGAS